MRKVEDPVIVYMIVLDFLRKTRDKMVKLEDEAGDETLRTMWFAGVVAMEAFGKALIHKFDIKDGELIVNES